MRLLCPAGGTYWNPTPFWWLRNTYVATFAIRIWQAARFFGWLAAAALSLLGTLVFQVLFPALLWAWTLLISFINFYIGLLMGQIVAEALVFVPFMLFALFWLNWLVWPKFGCFVEDAWPVARQLLDLGVTAITIAVQILDLGIRIWNSMVPVIGFFIYAVVELQVQWYRIVNEILGEEQIDMLIDGMMSIMFQLGEISINVTESLISISPTILQVTSTVIGAVMTVVLEVSPQLLEITTYVFRILPFTLAPITSLIVKVVEFVKKTFFLGRLLLEAGGLYSASLAATASHPTSEGAPASDAQTRLWHAFGEASSHYWTPVTARRNTEHLDRLSAWLLKYPPGSFSDYYVTAGFVYQDTQASSYYAGRAPLQHTGNGDAEHTLDERSHERSAELPEGWSSKNYSHTKSSSASPSSRPKNPKAYPYAQDSGPLSAEPLQFDSETERHQHYDGHTRLDGASHLQNDLHKRLPCRSRFCGGTDATVPHPLHTIGQTRKRDQSLLSDSLVPKDVRAHRRRYAHVATLLHATRHAVHYSLRKHWRDGEGHLGRHLKGVLRQWTGHDTVHGALESVLSRHDHPMDSLATMVPVLSEWGPFRALLQYHPERDQFYGQWAAKRQVVGVDVTDPYTGQTHRVAHITALPRNESLVAQTLLAQQNLTRFSGRQPLQYDDSGGQAQPVGPDFPPPDPIFLSLTTVPPLPAVLAGLYLNGKLLEPLLPVVKMLSTHDCFDTPKHPWCLPGVPTQLICILRNMINVVPRDLPVRLCKYEEECADVGFCIHPRPSLDTPVWRVIRSRNYFVSWCWIKNFFVWLGVALGLIFPVLRLNLRICEVVVPLIGPAICGPIHDIVPEPISLQDGVCLWVYAYAVALVLITIYLLRFLWALVDWLRETLMGFFAMITAIRFMEQDRLDALSQEPWFEEMQLRLDRQTRARVHYDNVYAPVYRNVHEDDGDLTARNALSAGPQPFGDPQDAVGQMAPSDLNAAYLRTQQPLLLPPPQPLSRRIGADAEAGLPLLADRPRITPEGRRAMHHYVEALREGIDMFGAPRSEVRLEHVLEHEARWHPLIDTGHYSCTWMRAAMNEIRHQQSKRATRKPLFLGAKCTIGSW